MILTIFGATGLLGKHLLKQALYKEYTIKAFGRNVFTDFDEHKNLQLIPGALFDKEQVFVIQNSDGELVNIDFLRISGNFMPDENDENNLIISTVK